jgi:ribosomal protein L21E
VDKKTHIDVKVSVESIRDGLKKLIISEHSQLIADVIVSNLAQTDVGLAQLFRAMSGIRDKLKYKVGDSVLAVPGSLDSWEFDKDFMTQQGLIVQGRVKAKVLEVKPFKKEQYKLVYTCLKMGRSEGKEVQSMVEEKDICYEEEWPENLDLEGDDLPF